MAPRGSTLANKICSTSLSTAPAGWTEIGSEAFAPGFFIWNSEVGSRSVGVETFWFLAICQHHIVWDAVEVVEFTRKHTRNVREALSEIRRIIEPQSAALLDRRLQILPNVDECHPSGLQPVVLRYHPEHRRREGAWPSSKTGYPH